MIVICNARIHFKAAVLYITNNSVANPENINLVQYNTAMHINLMFYWASLKIPRPVIVVKENSISSAGN